MTTHTERQRLAAMGNAPDEAWAAIPGYEETYRISSLGRVYSSPRPRTAGGLLTWSPDRYGYPRVTLVQDGRQRKIRVHVLVMLTFVGPTPRGKEIRHLNGDSADPRLTNLAFGTHRENMADAIAHGRTTRRQFCKRGHERSGANLGPPTSTGGRPCLACRRDRRLVAK